MRKTIVILIGFLTAVGIGAYAQKTVQSAHAKFMELTKMFNGDKPYSCLAIVEVKYKENAVNALKDTSRLIYKNGSTYYRSPLVERVEASQGELIVNHELKTASFYISDSIKEVVYKELNVVMDKEFESMLEDNFERKDLDEFNDFVLKSCDVVWETRDGLEEISFTPKNPSQATLLSMKIRFDKEDKVRYYEYVMRNIYSTDWNGSSRFRLVRTIYDNFNYNDIPALPSKLSDFLEWNGWTIKLKKYSNYKLSVL